VCRHAGLGWQAGGLASFSDTALAALQIAGQYAVAGVPVVVDSAVRIRGALLADIGASDTDPLSTNILFRARVAVVAITRLWFYRAPLLGYVAQVQGAGVPVVARDHQADLARSLDAGSQRAVQVGIAFRPIGSVLEDTISRGCVTDPFGAVGREGGALIVVGTDGRHRSVRVDLFIDDRFAC